MPNFGTTISNYSWKVTNGFLSGTIGAMFDTIQSKLANGNRDKDVKFYWDKDKGGAILNVMARSLVGGAVSELSNEVMGQYKKLIGGKKLDVKRQAAETQLELLMKNQNDESKKYGKIAVNSGDYSILAVEMLYGI